MTGLALVALGIPIGFVLGAMFVAAFLADMGYGPPDH